MKRKHNTAMLLHHLFKICSVAALLFVAFSCIRHSEPPQKVFTASVVYRSPDLVITQFSENIYVHVSFLQTNDFGRVPCNGLIVKSAKECLVFDTPASESVSAELIAWLNDSLQHRIVGVIPTHFHRDCLAGLNIFHQHQIRSYANSKTIQILKETGEAQPQQAFTDSLHLKLGQEDIFLFYPGEGHTRDNIVGYVSGENLLFGGCLIKELGANEGYTGDANIKAWPHTVQRVKQRFPNLRLVIPGHGAVGGPQLLDYTIQLFEKAQIN